MTADDDDDGLKSLRAVWLSMPDEDPPERGLADLMAAARVKANEMTVKPSLWQRFMESLRRPPVLALATVMVLIGGAVLVGNRSKDMDAQPTVSAPEAPTATVATESAAGDEGRAASAGSAAVEAIPSAPPTIVGGMAPEQAAEEPKAAAPSMKRPEPRERRASKDSAANEKSPPTKSITAESKKSEKLDRGRDEDTMFLDSDGGADSLKQEPTTRPSGGATATTGTASPRMQAPSDSAALSSAPSVTQLHQSARAAAARGDCKSAQTLTERIAKQDPTYFKAKVVPDKTFDRCVVAQ